MAVWDEVPVGVDAGSGLVHTVATTSANVHDVTAASELIRKDDEVAYGDSGHLGIFACENLFALSIAGRRLQEA